MNDDKQSFWDSLRMPPDIRKNCLNCKHFAFHNNPNIRYTNARDNCNHPTAGVRKKRRCWAADSDEKRLWRYKRFVE